jgi:hypothetical protein
MSREQRKPWYVAERAEALAGLFLLDLGPDYLGKPTSAHAPYDFLATFSRDDKSVVTVSVEVKGTDGPLGNPYPLMLPSSQVAAMQRSNTPFLIVVVDVRTNAVGFNWASALQSRDGTGRVGSHAGWKLPLRMNTPEEMAALRREILGGQDGGRDLAPTARPSKRSS